MASAEVVARAQRRSRSDIRGTRKHHRLQRTQRRVGGRPDGPEGRSAPEPEASRREEQQVSPQGHGSRLFRSGNDVPHFSAGVSLIRNGFGGYFDGMDGQRGRACIGNRSISGSVHGPRSHHQNVDDQRSDKTTGRRSGSRHRLVHLQARTGEGSPRTRGDQRQQIVPREILDVHRSGRYIRRSHVGDESGRRRRRRRRRQRRCPTITPRIQTSELISTLGDNNRRSFNLNHVIPDTQNYRTMFVL